jgi:3-hydroxyacyl-[acyl-carrier-protein] dehydratase
MPLATFEGSIRVGQEKAVMVEEITLTFGFMDAVATPVPVAQAASPIPVEVSRPTAEPLAAAMGT